MFRQAIDASDDDDEEDIVRYKNLAIVLEEPIGMYSQEQYWDSFWSEYKWRKSRSLTNEAVANRRKQAKAARDKAKDIESRIVAEKAIEEDLKRKATEEARQVRIAAYWEAHADEKEKLESEKKELTDKKEKLTKEISAISSKISEETPTGNVPSEDEVAKLKDQIKDLEKQRAALGIFAGKEMHR